MDRDSSGFQTRFSHSLSAVFPENPPSAFQPRSTVNPSRSDRLFFCSVSPSLAFPILLNHVWLHLSAVFLILIPASFTLPLRKPSQARPTCKASAGVTTWKALRPCRCHSSRTACHQTLEQVDCRKVVAMKVNKFLLCGHCLLQTGQMVRWHFDVQLL